MTYASLLVHAEADPACEARLKLAVGLANQFGARLIGAASEIFDPPGYAASYANVDGELLIAEAKAIEDDLKLAEQRFNAVAKGVTAGAEWRCGVCLPADMLAETARAADLVITGPHRSDSYGFHNRVDPGDLVMHAGRPVLVTPQGQEALDASSIVVAWKNTREARRAVADALPFLKQAKQVLVAEVCESRDEADARAGLNDVADYLARHGVKASTAVRQPMHDSVPATLLAIAEMQEAGLIVAGGYGHARMREWVFGGVTRGLLAGVARPVLFSH